MTSLKTIKINPQAFLINKTYKKAKKDKKYKLQSHIKPNTLKKALLRRIKEKAQKEKHITDNKNKKTKEDTSVSSDFQNHLNYLTNLSNQHKYKQKSKNKTLKTKSHIPDIPEKIINIHTELPNELILSTINNKSENKQSENKQSENNKSENKQSENKQSENNKSENKQSENKQSENKQSENNIITSTNYTSKPSPPYSCLKNSSKPTYRQWKNITQKTIPNVEKTIPNVEKIIPNVEKTTQENNVRTRILNNNKRFQRKPVQKIYQKKTIKRRYKFGKSNGKIGILIKNNKTRKIIQNEVALLYKAPIKEIKEYLRKHYLYKVGSNAPNDILRKTYVDAHLSGEITNKSTESLVHNYLNN
jgi:hypothetical protein